MTISERMAAALEARRSDGTLRSLRLRQEPRIDFISNDYLGFSRLTSKAQAPHGSTGSRLISGNSELHRDLEELAAEFHNGEAALLFNSGYDANLALAGMIASRRDTVILDELAHASMHDGARLGSARAWSFRHNDPDDLRAKLGRAGGDSIVFVESLYSMDGDAAPLGDLVSVCEEFGAALVVDEAHATGVRGPRGEGLVSEMGLESRIFARVHTFGKALGSHGSVVVGSNLLVEYLINFGRSFVYTTAIAPGAVAVTIERYGLLVNGAPELAALRAVSTYFDRRWAEHGPSASIIGTGEGPIRSVILGDVARARAAAARLDESGIASYAVVSPTVRAGAERIRICLHAFNTEEEIDRLIEVLATL